MRLSSEFVSGALLPGLRTAGIDPASLLVGDESTLRSGGPGSPFLDPRTLFDMVESTVENPLALLRSGWMQAPPETPLNLLLASQPTVRHLLAEFQEFGVTLVQELTLTTHETGSRATIEFVSNSVNRHCAVVEWWVASFGSFLQHATGYEDLVQRLLFRHKPRTTAAQYKRHLGVRTDFARPIDGLEIAAADLDRPLTRSSSMVASTMRRLLREELVGRTKPIHYQIEAETHLILLSHLGSRQGTQIADIARELGMSLRSYQRRLQSTGRSFREVKERAFVDFAKSLLSESEDSLDRISRRSGFSHKSAFHRAFKRATGKTPASYRSSSRGQTASPAHPLDTTRGTYLAR